MFLVLYGVYFLVIFFSKLSMGRKLQKPQPRGKLVKELLEKQATNDATLQRGVAGKFQAMRMGQRLDYLQLLAVLAQFGPAESCPNNDKTAVAAAAAASTARRRQR